MRNYILSDPIYSHGGGNLQMKQVSKKIIQDFKWYYRNNYITQRDGNACVRIGDNEFIITPSGVQKQDIKEDSLILVDIEGNTLKKTIHKPSIELHGHLSAMKVKKEPVSVHVHSMNTVALFSLASKMGFLKLLEANFMEKWPELFRYTKLGSTVGYLEPGSHGLHHSIKDSFEEKQKVDIIVLDRHGVISLGNSLDECKEHIQRLEHVSEITLKMLSASNLNLEILK